MNDEARDRVCDLRVRDRAQVAGFISSLVLRPAQGPRAVEADLTDGTGTVSVLWLGQDRIPGIGPGTRLRVEGTVARRGHHLVIHDPRYEILGIPGEEDG
jgi:hypothetical protein